MSKTIVDMAKVTQALDSGWNLQLFKGGLGSYVVIATGNEKQMASLQNREKEWAEKNPDFPGLYMDDDGECTTDDFTPEQALTRAAYKVLGEILP